MALLGLLAACSGSTAGDSDGAATVDLAEIAQPDLTVVAGDPGPGPTKQCTYTPDSDGFFSLSSAKSDYWVRLPVNYDPKVPSRLLVAIHGCGDTAKNFATWGAAPYDLRKTQDYIAISIGGRDNACWDLSQDLPTVMAAVTDVRSCFFVHQKKMVVAGYSSGGMMAYKLGMTNAAAWAGILIENSGLSQGVGNVDQVLTNAAWKINVAHSARLQDGSFAIAGVQADRDKMLAHNFPLQYRELPGDHNGSSDDWVQFLLPKMATWTSP